MSSRQLKKLRKQQELANLQKAAASDDEEASDLEPEPVKPRASGFSAFAALGDGNDEDNDDDEPQEPETIANESPKPAPEAVTPAKKSKKSKKKKKAKKIEEEAPAVTGSKAQDEGLDEIDRALKELNMSPAPDAAKEGNSQTTPYSHELAKLLSINTHHLKVLNEMRALFGRETIEAARAEDEAEAQQNRRQRQVPQNVDLETFLKGRPGQKMSEVLIRRNPFIQGKDTWPRASAGGLSMEALVSESSNFVEYKFSHDKTYDELEAKFFAYVQLHDPMQIVYFLHRNPYHVSSLIQVSRIAKQDQNSALSADLCERALFTIGRVTLSTFRKRIEQGTARMSFDRPENRQFWLAGYHYIKSLLQKGTYRTALEWTKLFISIAPEDEYGMMNWTHALAIRAHQAQWFVDLCGAGYFETWRLHMREYYKQTLVLAKLQLKDVGGARIALLKGMEELPWLYSSLYSALNLDTPKAVWGIRPRDGNEELYTELYINTAKDLWNNTQAVSLLKEAGDLAQKVDAKSLPKARDIPLSIGRFVYLDNTPALMSLVPKSMLHATPNFDFDPLPPPKQLNVFSSEAQKLPWDAPTDFWQTANAGMDPRMRQIMDQAMAQAAERAVDGPDNVFLNNDSDGDDDSATEEDEPPPLEETTEAEARGLGPIQRFLEYILPMQYLNRGGDNGAAEEQAAWMEDDDDQDYLGEPPPLERADARERDAEDSEDDRSHR